MRILITGSSGFIGENIIRVLDVHSLLLAARNPAVLRNILAGFGVVSLEEILDGEFPEVDAVVHLAGRAHLMRDNVTDPLMEYTRINHDLSLKLADSALKAGVKKFVYASTVKVMGEGRRNMAPLTEEAPFIPECPYAISKMEAEKGLRMLFIQQKSSKLVILRLPMVYGPGNKGNMLSLLKMASRGIPLPLGAVKAKRSMVYIGNLCDAIKKVIEDEDTSRPSVQTFFITDRKDISSRELYSLLSREYCRGKGTFYAPTTILRLGGLAGSIIEKAVGITMPLNKDVVSRLMDEYRFSSEAFCRDYGWTPPYSPEEGIKDTVDWYKASVLTRSADKNRYV